MTKHTEGHPEKPHVFKFVNKSSAYLVPCIKNG